MTRSVGAGLGGVAAAIGVAGFRYQYQEFYGALGVGFDELGIGTWQMTTATIAAWLGLLPLLVVPAAVATAMFRWLRRRGDAWPAAFASGGVCVMGLVGVADLFSHVNDVAWSLLIVAGLVLVGTVVVSRVVNPSPALRTMRRYVALPTTAGIAAVVLLMWVAGTTQARTAANALDADGRVTRGTAAMLVLDVPRAPVCAEPAAAGRALPPTLTADAEYLRLGIADGIIVLLDPAQPAGSGIRRIPATAALFPSRARGDTCS